MFDGAFIGQYIPGHSLIHRLDPRIKTVALLFILTGLLICRTVPGVLLTGGIILLHLIFSQIGLKEILKGLKPLLPILIFAFLINLFIPRDTDPLLFHLGFLKISKGSLINAVLMSYRVAALVLISNLFLSLTTSAMQLCDGMTSLLSPLNKLKVPVQDISMMMSIALRFVPTLMEETDKIMKAQSSRGADYDTGGLMKKVRGFVTVLVPLFISAFRRAEALASAMEARAYRCGAKRGKLHPLKMTRFDIIYFVVLIILLTLFVVIDFRCRI